MIKKAELAKTPPLPVVDPVELLLAAIGIKAIVSRKVERIGKAKLQHMHDLPEKIHKDIQLIISGQEPVAYKPEAFDYRQTLEDLAKGWDIGQVQQMIAQFPPGFRVAGSALIVRSQEIIKAMLRDYPASIYQTVSGSDTLAPSDTRMFKFVNVLNAIDHPESIPYWIHCGGLLQSQAKAMRAVYPTLSEFIDASLFNVISQARAESSDKAGGVNNFQLPSHVEYGIKSWWGRPPISDQSLAKAQMVAKASAAKQQAQQQQQSQPPTRSNLAESPDSTALGRSEAALG